MCNSAGIHRRVRTDERKSDTGTSQQVAQNQGKNSLFQDTGDWKLAKITPTVLKPDIPRYTGRSLHTHGLARATEQTFGNVNEEM